VEAAGSMTVETLLSISMLTKRDLSTHFHTFNIALHTLDIAILNLGFLVKLRHRCWEREKVFSADVAAVGWLYSSREITM